MARDTLYATPLRSVSPFRFTSDVVQVFDDMIDRSVPNYRDNLSELVSLALGAVQPQSSVYDLGCSLGAFAIPFARSLRALGEKRPADVRVKAVDSSSEMLSGLMARAAGLEVEAVHGQLEQTKIENASVVVLNYTLQFVPLAEREQLLKRIAGGTRPGGVLLLSEKIVGATPRINRLHVDRHHEFKRRNGYSELEIAQKRQSLENVLVAESIEAHLARLRSAGYSDCAVWHQFHNFVSIYAQK